MARPAKRTVDYFPHIIKQGKTMTILENKFGNDGYSFWFKLLEILGSTDGHFYEYRNITDIEFLLAKTNVSKEVAEEILELLANLKAIDKQLWAKKVIWSDNFVSNIEDAYSRRKVNVPHKPSLDIVSDDINNSTDDITEVNDNINPQSKVKESKVNKSKVNKSKEDKSKEDKDTVPYTEIVDYLNSVLNSQYRSSTSKTRDLIKARWNEGFRLEDFKTVIDKKVAEWLGNKKCEKWLRPYTLFSNKFENYLNQLSDDDSEDEEKMMEKYRKDDLVLTEEEREKLGLSKTRKNMWETEEE